MRMLMFNEANPKHAARAAKVRQEARELLNLISERAGEFNPSAAPDALIVRCRLMLGLVCGDELGLACGDDRRVAFRDEYNVPLALATVRRHVDEGLWLS
jgi:hypothetical protein